MCGVEFLEKEQLHSGHRERVKERFLRAGLDGFEEHNVLELMLFYAIPMRDTNDLAHRLINTFGSLDKVQDASVEDLCAVPGVGRNTATLLKLFSSVSRYQDLLRHKPKVHMSKGEAIAEYARVRNRGNTEEVFSVIGLDAECCFLTYEEISHGSVSATEINIRRAVDALLRARAVCVVMVHNHPSGNLTPSVEDLMTTRTLRDAFHLINLKVIDHLIVSDDDYLSMRAQQQFTAMFD